ncbi:type III secretion system LEE export apparatus protein EscT, partial [Escherichia coli]|nr:type III secretion system LEE export apparatus protein EscT [Escherichia coli]
QSILDKLYLSYEILPLQADIAFNRALIDFLFSLWDSFIKLMLSFSVPMIIGIFLCDMGFGFLNKTAPQLNVFTLSLPVKSLIAIFILLLVIHVFPDFITANIHSDIIDRSLPSMINE